MKTYKTKLDGVLMIEIDIFEDERYSYLANRLIFENNPEILSKSDYKKIHSHFAENFLATEKKPFTMMCL